jgi:hypothetical protein
VAESKASSPRRMGWGFMMADLDLISMGERQNFELGEVSSWVTGDTETRRNGEVEASGN